MLVPLVQVGQLAADYVLVRVLAELAIELRGHDLAAVVGEVALVVISTLHELLARDVVDSKVTLVSQDVIVEALQILDLQ